MKVDYSVAVVYTGGLDYDMDERIVQLLKGSGVVFDGGGFFFATRERDLVFFSKTNLKKEQISNIRRILRNIRRWTRVVAASIERIDNDE